MILVAPCCNAIYFCCYILLRVLRFFFLSYHAAFNMPLLFIGLSIKRGITIGWWCWWFHAGPIGWYMVSFKFCFSLQWWSTAKVVLLVILTTELKPWDEKKWHHAAYASNNHSYSSARYKYLCIIIFFLAV